MSDQPEWTIRDEIPALIWFTRVLPLLTLFVLGALYLRVTMTPATMDPAPDYVITQGVTL